MLGSTVSFPQDVFSIDPNAGNNINYPDLSLGVNDLPLRSTPLYGVSNAFATDAVKGSSTNYTNLAIAAVLGFIVLKFV